MKNEKMLEELKKVVLLSEKEKIKTSLNVLIEKLQQEILVEENKNLSSKQRLNKCLNYHKKLLKSPRPILAYSCNDQIEDRQVFTNAYYLVALKTVDQLPIPDYKESNLKINFPDITRIFSASNYNEKTFTCNVGKLLNAFKSYNNIHLLNEKTSFSACLSKENFELFILHLNYKNSDNITLYATTYESPHYCDSTLRPVYTKNENGSDGVILPIKYFDGYKTFNESDLN